MRKDNITQEILKLKPKTMSDGIGRTPLEVGNEGGSPLETGLENSSEDGTSLEVGLESTSKDRTPLEADDVAGDQVQSPGGWSAGPEASIWRSEQEAGDGAIHTGTGHHRSSKRGECCSLGSVDCCCTGTSDWCCTGTGEGYSTDTEDCCSSAGTGVGQAVD